MANRFTSWRDGGKTNEEGISRWFKQLFTGGAFMSTATAWKVSQRGAGANMSVDVAIGDGFIPYGNYGFPNWTDLAINTTVDPADATNPRKDIVVAYVDLSIVSSSNSNNPDALKFKAVAGSPAGSPADPNDAAIQSSIGSGNPFKKLARVDVPANDTAISDSQITDLREPVTLRVNTGDWNLITDSWAYSAWDSTYKIGTITVPTDATTAYSKGMRIRISQSTGGTKYGIIVDITSTTLKVFFGTDYTLNNEAISTPAFSSQKAPFGFPLDPTKWTVNVTDTSSRSQASPGAGTWYNPGSVAINIPIGVWDVRWQANIEESRTGSASALEVYATLSTANNSQSDSDFTAYSRLDTTSTTAPALFAPASRKKTIVLSSNTPYYLNLMTNVTANATIYFRNDISPANISAVCAYL